MKRNKWAAVLFAVLLFGCGALCGALAEHYFSTEVVNAKTSSEDFRHNYVSEMKSKLNLTQDQVDKLEDILDDTKAKYKAVRDSTHPALVKIKEEQITRVKSILNPQQAAIYEQLVADREKRFKVQEDREHQADLKREAEHRAHSTK